MSVQVIELPNGDVQLVAEVQGVPIAFASHSAGRIAQLVERGKNLAERAENGDELARDQIGKPLAGSESSSKPVSAMKSDELDELAEELDVEDFPYDGKVAEKRAAIAEHKANVGEEE